MNWSTTDLKSELSRAKMTSSKCLTLTPAKYYDKAKD
jgi:hypothetical protein